MKDLSVLILENIPLAVIVYEKDGTVRTANSAARQMLGIPAEKGALGSIREYFKDNDKALDAINEALKGNEVRDLECPVRGREGKEVPVSLTARRLEDHGQGGPGFIMVAQDLTQVKKLEEHVRTSDKLAALGTMAAGMAHEIKNPLSSIKVLTQLLSRKFNDQSYRLKFIEIMPREISRIDRIIDSLMGYARTNHPNFEPVSLNEVISESMDYLKENIETYGITAVTELEPLPDIMADRQQVSQVFVNILLNAVQAMKAGGTLSVTGRTSGEGDASGGDRIICEISDTGPGIKKEYMGKLFDPFFTTKYGGTGLGLTVVHGIIEAHGGLIEVESAEGKGALFRILLPVEKDTRK